MADRGADVVGHQDTGADDEGGGGHLGLVLGAVAVGAGRGWGRGVK
jgi:hypothetical protein